MSAHDIKSAERPPPDAALVAIAEYARNFKVKSPGAYETARYCLMDTLACGFQALKYPACRKLLGPVVPGAVMPGGARVPGTSFELDPVQAAFNIGAMIRWLDFNDTWLAAEWGHPSDNLGGLLAVSDYLARQAVMSGRTPLTVQELLSAMIKAHEIQGVLALENSFNRVGLDHVLLVRVASTAVVASLLGGTLEQVVNAVSNAWIDGGALRTYRHAPNTGSRKSWAAGDATSRAVRLALIALTGEMGYPSALSARTWGFSDVLFRGKPIVLAQPFDSYVMENVLFKISYPAEFHAQTAVEAAMTLHPQVAGRLADIERVVIETQEPLYRQRRAGVFPRRQREPARPGRLPDRPPQTTRGRHAGAREEVRNIGGRSLWPEAGRTDQDAVRDAEVARCIAGERAGGRDGDQRPGGLRGASVMGLLAR